MTTETCAYCNTAITLADDGAWNDAAGACGCTLSPHYEHGPAASSELDTVTVELTHGVADALAELAGIDAEGDGYVNQATGDTYPSLRDALLAALPYIAEYGDRHDLAG